MDIGKASQGDAKSTPFVRFDGGLPMYPPNNIYECAEIVLTKLDTQETKSIFDELVERGDCSGKYGVLLKSTWFAIIGNFLRYRGQPDPGPPGWRELCIRGLRLMLSRPHQGAWDALKHYLTEDIDGISGWASSWKRSDSERQNIFRGDDGNYYREDDGILVWVIGAKTLAETRIDFITDQAVHNYGFIHQFLELFSLFSIADDFASNPNAYPSSMKAILPDPKYQRIEHSRHFLFTQRTRSFRWRPNSNMCDPYWLASDLLARMTDTLTVDHFRLRTETQRLDEGWVNDPCKYQIDYAVDSGLQIGSEEETYIEFEGTPIRWINGTPERNAVVSVPVKDINAHDEEDEKLNRFMSLLVWEHKQPIRKLWGVGGSRRPFPTAYSPRMAGGIQIDRNFLEFTTVKTFTSNQWLALALFREAKNSGSQFYAFLTYHKVLDLVFPKPDDKRNWINNVAPSQTREIERLQEILKGTTDLEHYFRVERLNAIKHIQKKPIVNPDDPKEHTRIISDIYVIEDLARLAIEKLLT
jgi:methylamine utilization protein MauJ